MTQQVVLFLLLMGMAAGQDSPQTVPPDKGQSEKIPFCGGTVNPPCSTPPRRAYFPDPVYPKKRGKAHLPGIVELALVVGSDGLPRDITVFNSLAPGFDEQAVDSVKKWRFQPATLDGKPAG